MCSDSFSSTFLRPRSARNPNGMGLCKQRVHSGHLLCPHGITLVVHTQWSDHVIKINCDSSGIPSCISLLTLLKWLPNSNSPMAPWVCFWLVRAYVVSLPQAPSACPSSWSAPGHAAPGLLASPAFSEPRICDPRGLPSVPTALLTRPRESLLHFLHVFAQMPSSRWNPHSL